jgi:DNA repair protein RadC
MSKEPESMSAEELLADLAAPADRSTSVKQLAQCLMLEFEGPAGLARDIRAAFKANTIGNASQIRVLNDVTKLMLAINSDDAESDDDDLESLEATHRQLVRQHREGQ